LHISTFTSSIFPASEREMKNELESGRAVSYLQVVESQTFREPIGHEDVGAPGNLGEVGVGGKSGETSGVCTLSFLLSFFLTDLTV
jgi:hypothetical protein